MNIIYKTYFKQLVKYGLVTVISQLILLVGSFIFVEQFKISPSVTYLILLSLIYIGVYVAYTKFVFEVEFSKERITRFIILLIIIWLLNNGFFNLMNRVFKIHYLLAIILNIIIFGFLRFFLQRSIVFSKEKVVKNKVILTFDLELWHESKWIQKNLFSTEDKKDYLEESVIPILDLLAEKNFRATFFVTTPVLKKYPDLIKQIASAGHEIGSHSFIHQRLGELNPESFRIGMREQIVKIKNLIGRNPLGFRAPHFSLDNKTKWVLPILAELGFKYDSSIFPVKTPEYGVVNAPLDPYKISSALWEIPPAVCRFSPIKIPVAGGVYFRIMPLWFFKKILNLVSLGRTPVLYFHPHELYAQTPKIKKGPFFKRKLKYFGKKNSFKKFEKLLDSFQFDSIENILKL